MREIITVDMEKCVGCNKCVRNCLVFDANIAYLDGAENKVKVDAEKCILCGKCIDICDHEARGYVDDTDAFFENLSKGRSISIVAAPAVRTNFKDYKRLFGFLKSRGVNVIYDVSFGADITTWAYLKAIKQMNIASVIAQPCPAIVNYIEKYKPDLLGKLAPVHSPTLCTALYLKKYANIQGEIAFLSPCIGKTSEFTDPNTGNAVQYNLTYAKLSEYIQKNNIRINDYQESEFEDIGCSLGCVFSRPGGLRENVEEKVKGAWIRQVEGQEHAYHYLDNYSDRVRRNMPVPLLVDILNCANGCNIGTATTKQITPDDADYTLNSLKAVKLNDKGGKLVKRKIDWLYDYFEKNLRLEDFMRQYTDRSHTKPLIEPTKSQYDEMFTAQHKTTEKDRSLNCSACGYSTCNDMVKAIMNNLNHINNCADYNRKEVLIEKNHMEVQNLALEAKNAEVNEMLNNVKKLSDERLQNSTKLEDIIKKLALTSDKVSKGVYEVNGVVDEIAANTRNVSEFARDVSSSVNRVVVAIKEINISLNEISKNCGRSKNITIDAENKTTDTNQIIEKLDSSSKQINKVVRVIDDIAEQTNMLALNAAIEAAGAGEAGKGFGVVAGEVKELAKQTAESTDEIANQIETMQTNMANAVSAMATISQVINEMTGITNTIASAVTEQSAVAGDISNAVIVAAEKVNLITDKMNEITTNAQSAAKSISEVSEEIKTLASAASELK